MTASPPIACDLSVLSDQQRDRLDELAGSVLLRVDRVDELEDGYALGFVDASTDLIVELAEFVALDRLCCAYMRHGVVCDAGPGVTWLELTGPPGTKAGDRRGHRPARARRPVPGRRAAGAATRTMRVGCLAGSRDHARTPQRR